MPPSEKIRPDSLGLASRPQKDSQQTKNPPISKESSNFHPWRPCDPGPGNLFIHTHTIIRIHSVVVSVELKHVDKNVAQSILSNLRYLRTDASNRELWFSMHSVKLPLCFLTSSMWIEAMQCHFGWSFWGTACGQIECFESCSKWRTSSLIWAAAAAMARTFIAGGDVFCIRAVFVPSPTVGAARRALRSHPSWPYLWVNRRSGPCNWPLRSFVGPWHRVGCSILQLQKSVCSAEHKRRI